MDVVWRMVMRYQIAPLESLLKSMISNQKSNFHVSTF